MRTILLLLVSTIPVFADWKAGLAAKVITPSEPIWMAGYGARKEPAKGKLHDLWVKALALEDASGGKFVIVTSDLCGIPRNLAEDVTAAVMKTGLKREAIMLTCSHTHSGPVVRENLMDMYDMPAAEREKVMAYYPKLRDAMIEVILNAVKDLSPATLAIGQGEAGFAVNRRAITDKGVSIGVNPNGPVDKSVPVLAIRKPSGELRGVLFGYACHNTTLSGQEWCGDYAGFAQIELEKAHPGAVAMFWIGCGADANPNPRREVAHAQAYGKQLATAVDGVLAKAMTPLTKPIAAHFEEIALDYAAVPTREELTKATTSKNFAEKTRALRLLSLPAIDAAYKHYPVQVWRFGDQLAWAALGGEVVVDYALRLKKEHTGTLWITGYANDVMAYIPSERVLKEGGYEADSSMIYYGLPSKWKAGLENKIIQATQRGLKPLTNGEPKTPQEEKATFQLVPGYRIDCIAAEPQVIDPVAMCFDHTGAIYVCEMIGYPNGGVATGIEKRGRIKKLLDKDGDGIYETAIVFADGLRFPTGITCWRDGVIVANAPDLTWYHDKDGDGVSDSHEILYTGFDLRNIQQLPSGLQFHPDGWIYAMCGMNGGVVTSPQKKDMQPLTLRGRGFRFKPDEPGNIEPTSGGGQYGLTHDGRGHWFTNTNAQHLRQIVIPDEYLRRNPYYAAPAVTVDIPEHGPAAKVFRISPFEAWRLERTSRRVEEKKKLPDTELVPGGYFTSACSPLYYRGSQFDPETVFVCDPANNLVHRERLEPTTGPLYKAVRIDADREFLASTDNWFRPVFTCQGPDDALYVLDFYREAIETPLSLPEDMQKRMNLESRQRGRIWRIAKEGNEPWKPKMPNPNYDLIEYFEALNPLNNRKRVQRDVLTRIIFEQMSKLPPSTLLPEVMSKTMTNKYAAISAEQLWLTLNARNMPCMTIVALLNSETEESDKLFTLMKMAEPYLKEGKSEPLVNAMRRWLLNPSPRVRFQAVLSLSADESFEYTKPELERLGNHLDDPWIASAMLIAMNNLDTKKLLSLIDSNYPMVFVKQAGAIYYARNHDIPIEILKKAPVSFVAMAALEGIAIGLRQSGKTLDEYWREQPAQRDLAAPIFQSIEKTALERVQPASARLRALNTLELLSSAARAELVGKLLVPEEQLDIQIAAVRLASGPDSPAVLIAAWPKATPKLRAALEEALLSKADRIDAFLKAIEAKTIDPKDVSALRVEQLRNSKTKSISDRAKKLFVAAINEDRKKVIDDYKPALELAGDKARGKAVFAKTCAACHRLENVGNDVGANLTAALPNKTKPALLIDILDPSREVDSRYVNYTVETKSGRTVTGVLAVETATSVTLRRAEKAEDTILRTEIESITASKKSLMPEDLEKTLTKQELADVMEYLVTVGK